jgi:hypothetical protein
MRIFTVDRNYFGSDTHLMMENHFAAFLKKESVKSLGSFQGRIFLARPGGFPRPAAVTFPRSVLVWLHRFSTP